MITNDLSLANRNFPKTDVDNFHTISNVIVISLLCHDKHITKLQWSLSVVQLSIISCEIEIIKTCIMMNMMQQNMTHR